MTSTTPPLKGKEYQLLLLALLLPLLLLLPLPSRLLKRYNKNYK
jgi:hypothetical protein